MELLKQNYQKVAVFKPVASKDDNDVKTLINRYETKQNIDQAVGFDGDEFLSILSNDKKYLFELLLEKYETLKNEYEFILILGIDQESVLQTVEYEINFELCKNFSSPFVGVLSAKGMRAEFLADNLKYELKEIENHKCEIFCTFVNMVENSECNLLRKKLQNQQNVYLLPRIKKLEYLSVSEILNALNAKQIFGQTRGLKRLVKNIKIISSDVETFVSSVKDDDFIIVDSSRTDIVLSTINMNYSKNGAKLSGVLLVGTLAFNEKVQRLIKGYEDLNLSILQVEGEIFDISFTIKHLKPSIGEKNRDKINYATTNFFDNVNSLYLQKKLLHSKSDIVTPLMFSHKIFNLAKSDLKTVVLPESSDERILRAAYEAVTKKIAKIILIAEQKEIEYKASLLGFSLEGITIINPKEYTQIEKLALNLYEKRKHKGMTLEHALDLLQSNSIFFATSLVDLNFADAMVCGAINSTADTIRPALQLIKTKPQTSIVSSIFFICLETKVLIYGDCAINKNPTARELADIAISSVQTARTFGIQPKVAMLSYSSGNSGSGEVVEKVKTATKLVKEYDNSIEIEGPIQYDAAVDVEVAKKKLPQSKVAGYANLFIFPDLNSGNNTYKAVQRSTGALAIGPVLQGLNKPINDLSRGCSVDDIVNTIAITAIQAKGVE